MNKVFSTWPQFTTEEKNAVKNILSSGKVNYWTGNECRKFEREFADWCQTKYAVALANGTVALDIAFKALNIGNGDEVIVTSRTYIASISSIINAGATPVFTDIDPISQNINPKNIQSMLTNKTKAILCVHLAGWPCEMDEIMRIAKNNNLFVIEDCAQAHGAIYKGKPVGSIGDIGCWSFCQDKIMSTGGEGGMVTTSNKKLWRYMWAYKDHGKSYDAVYKKDHPKGFRWLHESFGTNWRMTEIQAAIGRIQLGKMSKWTSIRNRNASILADAFKNFFGDKKLLKVQEFKCKSCPINNTKECKKVCIHAYYKYYVFVQPRALKHGWSRDRIIEEINTLGVQCMQGSCSEVYLESAFNGKEYKPKSRLTNAKKLGETSIMFHVHPTLNIKEMLEMSKIIVSVFRKAQN